MIFGGKGSPEKIGPYSFEGKGSPVMAMVRGHEMHRRVQCLTVAFGSGCVSVQRVAARNVLVLMDHAAPEMLLELVMALDLVKSWTVE
mgnify:CR=1 FL=1